MDHVDAEPKELKNKSFFQIEKTPLVSVVYTKIFQRFKG